MTWTGILTMMGWALLVVSSPLVFYLWVKMAAYGWCRGRELHEESRRKRHGDSKKEKRATTNKCS